MSEYADLPQTTIKALIPCPDSLSSTALRRKLRVHLSPHYRLISIDSLANAPQDELRALLDASNAEALLLPNDTYAVSVVPLSKQQREIFQILVAGCPWEQAVTLFSSESLNRLFLQGIICGTFGDYSFTGPIIPLIMYADATLQELPTLTTDRLSAQCIEHVSRMPISDLSSIVSRLYLYNHSGVYADQRLRMIAQQVLEVISHPITSFIETPPPAHNPGWHFFTRIGPEEPRRPRDASDYKIYLSPHRNDTALCLGRLVELLPRLGCHAWKVGRGHFGITRPDKICVYFASEGQAASAAEILRRELLGVETHGIPFTRWADTTGLISVGQDPPRPSSDEHHELPQSWREWVTRKIGAALLLAKADPQYPLSPAQSALWTMKLSGVDPSCWRVETKNIWRH